MISTSLASIASFVPGFQEILQRIERIAGFVLLPVEVPGPDVARALGDFLTSRGRPAIVIEPRNDAAAWKNLVATLYAAEPQPKGVVILIGAEDLPDAIHAGLRIFNQRRETLSERLGCPLLWCGPASFLNLSWNEAPDFWSIRSIDVRLTEEPPAGSRESVEPPAPSSGGAAYGTGAPSESERLRSLLLAARAQGDRAASANLAVRLSDALLSDGAVEEAERIIAEVIADPGREKDAPGPSEELLLQQAMIERRRGRAVAAAATLGALLGRPALAPHLRLRAGLAMAGVLEDTGDLRDAETRYREALALARASADLEAEARALIGAYGIAARTGRAAEADEPLAYARRIAERIGDPALASAAAAAQAFAAIGGHDTQKGAERTDQAKELREDAGRAGETEHAPDAGPVDVLVVTALQDELDAVLTLGRGWEERTDLSGFPYHQRVFGGRRGGKRPLVIAAAWLGRMGEVGVAIRGTNLLRELDPLSVAMCGICAGKRGDVVLGDVIVADRLYSYDHGKIFAKPGEAIEFHHDIETFGLYPLWKIGVANLEREIDLPALQARRPPSTAAQRRWLLHMQYAFEVEGGPPPVSLPERKARCPGWTKRIQEAIRDGLMALDGGSLALTPQGRELVLDERTLYPDGLPDDPDLQIHVGSIATGKTVQRDPELFGRLERLVRGTLGIEMEGAAIGELARHFDKRGIVVMAVSDYGDLQKDDSFRSFACQASAEVLLAFLLRYLELPERLAREHEIDDDDRGRRDQKSSRDGFLARVERVALLREPGATIIRHPAPAPFAGVLGVSSREGAFVRVRVIGALEQFITEALVTRYLTEVEHPFRQEYPYLQSTLIHTGPQADPDLLRSAMRRGVEIKTFAEYQGLIDFSRYLEWQTRALESDSVYPPGLYVDQPARWSLAGLREEQATESALRTLWDLLDSPHPRFALVLGDFGAGKTFLLHELARRMVRDGHRLVPVLVEMSRLEKQRSLRALLGQHFAQADEGRFDLKAFEYMLAEGRIALLFDGFDELALRLTYDRAMEHFQTVVQAAQGSAKVVVTSRTQHFLSEHQVRRALAERAEQVPGYRLFKIEKFGEVQIRRFLGNLVKDPAEAEARYQLLHEVKDLLGLSQNPRMLGFIARIAPEKLREAKKESGGITAAKLYEVLIDQWLDFEYARANPPGAPRAIPREKLRAAMTEVALLLWRRPEKSLEIGELPETLVAAMQTPGAPALERGVVEHLIGSGTLLVRDVEGRFSFVQRSVLEWLVAEAAAREVNETGDSATLEAGEMSELMADFFISMAGRDRAEHWAWHRDTRAEGATAKTAARVLRRLGVPAPVELEGQDLRGQDFSGVDWRSANLARADLRGATLVGARMSRASLAGARLGRADLARAGMPGVDLTGADLAFTRLTGADLRGAHGLVTAQFRGAKLVGAQGVEMEGLAEVGAAPPGPGKADPMWGAASGCSAVVWSPSGELVVSGHYDGSVQLWDADSGQTIRTISAHAEAVWSVAFSPDGRTLASGADDKTVRLWDIARGRRLRTLEGHTDRVVSVAFSPDGRTLASGADDKTVRLWELASGRTHRTLEGHTDRVVSVAFSPDGRTLASGADDKTVRLWELASGRTYRTLAEHSNRVTSVAFSPDGRSLASGSDDKTLRLWELASGRYLRALEGHTDGVVSIAFSPDGLTVATGSDDKTVRLWELASGRTERILEGHTKRVASVAFSPDGSTLATGSFDKTVRLWEVAFGYTSRALEGHTYGVVSVALSPDGLTIATGSSDKTVRLWELASGRTQPALEGHTDPVASVAFSPDGRILASGSYDKTVRLWEVASRRTQRALRGHTHVVHSVAFSPDGCTLATGSSDKTVRLWEVTSGRLLRTFHGHKDGVLSVAFSPDSHTLASASNDKTVRLWEVASGRTLHTLEGHAGVARSIAFSPSGLTLASGSNDKTVRLWQVGSGNILSVINGHAGWVSSVAFNPDARTLATGSNDNTVRVWEVATGRPLLALKGHKNAVSSVAFSPDGRTLASASADGTLRLWDVLTARCLAILLATPEGWAAFTPDGRYKVGGDIAGSFWHVIGLCRFEPGELDPYLPHLRLPDDASFLTLPPPGDR